MDDLSLSGMCTERASPTSSRPPEESTDVSKIIKLMLIAAVVAFTGTATAQAATWSLKPVSRSAKAVTFEVKRLPVKKVKRIRYVDGHKRRAIRVKRLRTAARRGYLTLRKTRRSRRTARAARVKKVTRQRKLVIVADTTAPETTITSAPSGTVSTTTAQIAFASNESGRFECRRNAGTWSGCQSVLSLSAFREGDNTVEVRAIDASGNVDASPAAASWTVAAAVAAAPPAPEATAPEATTGGFSDSFDTANGANGLITNEYAFWSKTDTSAVRSPDWEVTSGSLFSRDGRAWSGVVDTIAPDRYSQSSTGSWVFRMKSKRADLGSTRQEVSVKINRFFEGTATRPAVAWDGVVLWPRYKSETNLYFGYILRKDGRIGITKKCPGRVEGGDFYNDGSYFSLYDERFHATTTVGSWYRIGTETVDNADGSVTVRLLREGKVVAEVRDQGVGCAPISGPANVGIRADNAEFELDDYRATPVA